MKKIILCFLLFVFSVGFASAETCEELYTAKPAPNNYVEFDHAKANAQAKVQKAFDYVGIVADKVGGNDNLLFIMVGCLITMILVLTTSKIIDVVKWKKAINQVHSGGNHPNMIGNKMVRVTPDEKIHIARKYKFDNWAESGYIELSFINMEEKEEKAAISRAIDFLNF